MTGLWTDSKVEKKGRERRKSRASIGRKPAPARARTAPDGAFTPDLTKSIATTTLAFSGYDLSNRGRSAELLEHPTYGAIVREVMGEAERIYSDVLGTGVDLIGRIRTCGAGTPETLPEDLATIVAMQIAQVRLLKEVIGVPIQQARSSFGHSIGELSALIVGGVFSLRQVLSIILSLARDCAELAADTSMGVLHTSGEPLPLAGVQRLCLVINHEGPGLIAPSAYLSPSAVLLLGQGDTLDRFERAMGDIGPMPVMLRRRPGHWPPLHTPLVWQKNITDRTALALYRLAGGFQKPVPPIISCVTGAASYSEQNSRDLLIQWTDHPQLLWNVFLEVLRSNTDLVVHVGPAPALIPKGFARIRNAVAKRSGHASLWMVGGYLLAGVNGHSHGLTRLLPCRAALLRAPFVKHVVLEDYLLAQPIAT
jgi:[acyl-carrier-protein] S-malonyltransferase